MLDEGFSAVERTGERWAESELHRLRGQLLQLRGERRGRPKRCLRRACESHVNSRRSLLNCVPARRLQHTCSIRTGNGEAKALLSEVLGEWPMDFDSADLRDARALFAKLD